MRRLLFALILAAGVSVPAVAHAAPRCLPAQCSATQVSITENGHTWICWSDFSLCWEPGWSSWMRYGRWIRVEAPPVRCTTTRPCSA